MMFYHKCIQNRVFNIKRFYLGLKYIIYIIFLVYFRWTFPTLCTVFYQCCSFIWSPLDILLFQWTVAMFIFKIKYKYCMSNVLSVTMTGTPTVCVTVWAVLRLHFHNTGWVSAALLATDSLCFWFIYIYL